MKSLAKLLLLSSLVLATACASETAEDEDSSADAVEAKAPLGPDPRGKATAYPILLISGFGTSPTYNTFKNVPGALRADGHDVYVADLPPFDSTAVRGAALAKQIDAILKKTGAKKINLIGHSSGGTDAREVITPTEGSTLEEGYGDRVASITTISSAHGGSPLADAALDAFDFVHDDLGVSDEAFDALGKWLGKKFSDMAADTKLRAGITSMTVRNAGPFNDSHPDDARVYYQSWAGVAGLAGVIRKVDDSACEGKRFGDKRVNGQVHLMLSPLSVALGSSSNDAIVPVEHAKHGNFRGCVPADHLGEIGGNPDEPQMNKHSGFDHVRFYRLMAFELAAKGF